MSIISWIENNEINYKLISKIIKNETYGIATEELVNKYNEKTMNETKEEITKQPLTVEIFEHIIKTIERAPQTFNNYKDYEFDKETSSWFSKNKKNIYLNEIKKLKEQLKLYKEENINLKKKFNKISNEDF
jgi:hypothetical protein